MYLENNSALQHLPATVFAPLVRLSTLSLWNSTLSSLDPATLLSFRSLRHLFFTSDRFVCNCTTEWLAVFLQSLTISSLQSTISNSLVQSGTQQKPTTATKSPMSATLISSFPDLQSKNAILYCASPLEFKGLPVASLGPDQFNCALSNRLTPLVGVVAVAVLFVIVICVLCIARCRPRLVRLCRRGKTAAVPCKYAAAPNLNTIGPLSSAFEYSLNHVYGSSGNPNHDFKSSGHFADPYNSLYKPPLIPSSLATLTGNHPHSHHLVGTHDSLPKLFASSNAFQQQPPHVALQSQHNNSISSGSGCGSSSGVLTRDSNSGNSSSLCVGTLPFDTSLIGGNGSHPMMNDYSSSATRHGNNSTVARHVANTLRYAHDRNSRFTNPYQVVTLMNNSKAGTDEPLVPSSGPFRTATAMAKARQRMTAEQQPLTRPPHHHTVGVNNKHGGPAENCGHITAYSVQRSRMNSLLNRTSNSSEPDEYSYNTALYPPDNGYLYTVNRTDDEPEELEDYSEHTYATVLNGSDLYLPGSQSSSQQHSQPHHGLTTSSQSECSSCDISALGSVHPSRFSAPNRPITEL